MLLVLSSIRDCSASTVPAHRFGCLQAGQVARCVRGVFFPRRSVFALICYLLVILGVCFRRRAVAERKREQFRVSLQTAQPQTLRNAEQLRYIYISVVSMFVSSNRVDFWCLFVCFVG